MISATVEAQEVLGLIMTGYNEVNTAVLGRRKTLPAGCAFDDDVVANIEHDSTISQWSRGFRDSRDGSLD